MRSVVRVYPGPPAFACSAGFGLAGQTEGEGCRAAAQEVKAGISAASYGSAGLLVVVGGVCAVAFSGGVGQVLALVLIGLGFVLAVSLVFLEVGLSEDRERAREDEARAQRERDRQGRALEGEPSRPARPRSRLDRMRGRSRKLR